MTNTDPPWYNDMLYKNSLGSYPQRELTGIEFDIASGCSVMQAWNGTAKFEKMEPEITDAIVDKMWSKMFDKPAIIPCSHCNCHNAFTNSNCVSCGAPMGDSWKWNP